MATALQIPLQDYLEGSFAFETDPEYVDGAIEERPMGEYDHATWQDAILAWFRPRGQEWGIRTRPELRVQVAATRYRIPDVVVFSRSNPIEQTLTTPPIAVFEILSPEDRMSRMLIKLADYEKMGIQAIRVIDSQTHAVYSYQAGTLEHLDLANDRLSDNPQCSIDWRSVIDLLD